MLASVLGLIGLDKTQEAFKLALEEKAHAAVYDVKGVVVLMAGRRRGELRFWRSSLGFWIFTSRWSPPMGYSWRLVSLAGFSL
jgi:hypothetical protein